MAALIDNASEALDYVSALFGKLPARKDYAEQAKAVAWREGHLPAESFGELLTADHHRMYSVGRPETIWPTPVESSRTRRGRGGEVETLVEVRWAFALRADHGPEDYRRAALSAEAELVDAVRRHHEYIEGPIRLSMVAARTATGAVGTATDLAHWVFGVMQIRADHGYRGRRQ